MLARLFFYWLDKQGLDFAWSQRNGVIEVEGRALEYGLRGDSRAFFRALRKVVRTVSAPSRQGQSQAASMWECPMI